jgi:hypothetical protein
MPTGQEIRILSWHTQMGFEVHPNPQSAGRGKFSSRIKLTDRDSKSLPPPGTGVRNSGGITYPPHLHGNFRIKNRQNCIFVYSVWDRVNKTVGLNVIFSRARNLVHSHSLDHQYKERRRKEFDNVGGRQNKCMNYEKPLSLHTHLNISHITPICDEGLRASMSRNVTG